VQNRPEVFNYFELGGTYHFRDFEQTSKTTMVLFKDGFKGNKWASMLPNETIVPCKVRKIYGIRGGTLIWNSTFDLSQALKSQGLTNAALVNSSNVGLPVSYTDTKGITQDFRAFSNIYSADIYVGGSMTWIRNIAVTFDKYDPAVDDGIMSVFFDLIVAPYMKVDDVQFQNDQYQIDPLKTRKVGFRAGIDGRFNRVLSWGYGGEFGYRPSVAHRGFFAMFKISIPLYGTNLDNKVEAYGKE